MIWIWLIQALKWLLRLVIPNPYSGIPTRIDRNRTCTACGNKGGALEFRMVREVGQVTTVGSPAVVHTCATCGFMEWFKPVGVPLHPFVPETSHSTEEQLG